MSKLTLYTMPNCQHCDKAKQALSEYGFEYECISIPERDKRHEFYDSISQEMAVYPETFRRTMPKLKAGKSWVPTAKDIVDMCAWGLL